MLAAKKGMKIHHRHFHSIQEFMADCDAANKVQRNSTRRMEIKQDNRGADWLGVGSRKEVVKAVSEGWKEGAEAIESLYTKMVRTLPRAIDVRRKRVRGDIGEELDIHSVYRGDLSRAWSQMSRAMRHGTSLVRIVADVCDNSHVSAEQLKWRGYAALALSRILNKAGYSTEICVAVAVKNATENGSNGQIVLTTVTVKPRHVVQDTRMLAATVALPGYFRHYGFIGITRRCDELGQAAEGGLGQAIKSDGLIEPDARVLQTVTPPLRNNTEVEKWIATTVKLFQKSTMQAEGGR